MRNVRAFGGYNTLFEEHGYISINEVSTNRRCNELHLTEKGEALVAALIHR